MKESIESPSPKSSLVKLEIRESMKDIVRPVKLDIHMLDHRWKRQRHREILSTMRFNLKVYLQIPSRGLHGIVEDVEATSYY